MEGPLRAIDPALEQFASERRMVLGRNYHSWPERSLTWGTPISRLIQLYLEDEQALTWRVWLCASEDRDGARYWKQTALREGASIADIVQELPSLLQQAFTTVDSWLPDELELVRRPS